MSSEHNNILREGRDSFFQFFKFLWWPEEDENKLPSPGRQLDLFKRICIEYGEEFWLKCSLDNFNSILTECNQPIVRNSFFNYFFPNMSKKIRLGDFIKGIRKFQKIALWKYGSYLFAFERLRLLPDIKKELKEIPFEDINSVPQNLFTNRNDFDFIIDLSPEHRYLLGYATGNVDIPNKEIEKIKAIGKKNAKEYLSIDELDVYVATSMREIEEFRSFKKLVNEIFSDPRIAKLKIRYFDPTVGYLENRISKGLLEALMLKRSKITLYFAGEKDTFGKDSECAATLVQGKPVIVYIEETGDERKDKLNRRADVFKKLHPLGLQVCHKTGVANGIIVVRNAKDCSEIILRLLLNNLKVILDKEVDVGFVLKEEITQSILRVSVEDEHLLRSFENYYFKEL